MAVAWTESSARSLPRLGQPSRTLPNEEKPPNLGRLHARGPATAIERMSLGRPQALSGVPADDGFDSAPAAKRGGRIEIKYCMS